MSELFSNAAEIMLVGMGAVLAFLLLVMLVMTLMAALLPKPEPIPNRSATSANRDTASEKGVSQPVVAAIGAAIHRYRNTQNK